MPFEEIDILIIGAGPSGSSTALHLLSRDPSMRGRIMVVDKKTFPRQKLCGGGLTEDAETILRELGLNIEEIPNVVVGTLYFSTPVNQFEYRSLNSSHTLRVIDRATFDDWLLSKLLAAGVQVRQGVTVTNIQQTATDCLVSTQQGEIKAKVVVLAEGSNGTLSRLAFPGRKPNKARLVEWYTDENNLTPGQAVFDYSPINKNINGYYWDFPSISGLRAKGFFDSTIGNGSIGSLAALAPNGQVVGGHPILQFTPRHNNQNGRILAVGDCAGADPLLGEGISFALGTGANAAQHIIKAMQRPNWDLAHYQWTIINSPMGRSLYIRWIIAHILFGLPAPVFQWLIWDVLNKAVIWIARHWVLGWARKKTT